CLFWSVKPNEVFRGPWNHVTKNKVLIIGTSLDPVTPVESAAALETLMEGSGVFLRHEGHGHGSLRQPSLCTIKTVQDYMVRGVVPKKGSVCTAD
ncbi:peptidase S33 tripeptidyl aminopeptidase-like protein, partial [Blyttiomyces helicus]